MRTSASDSELRQLTLRVNRGLYRRVTQTAKARHTSVNALIGGLLLELERAEKERELVRAYELLGRDAGGAVAFAEPAQAEVAAGD